MIELIDNSLKRKHSGGIDKFVDSETHSGEHKATSHKKSDLIRLFLGVSSYSVFLLIVLTLLVINRYNIANSMIFILSMAIFLVLIIISLLSSLLSILLLRIGYVIPAVAEDRGQKIDWTRGKKLRKYSFRIFNVVVVVSMICVSLPPMIFIISPADAPLTFLLGLILPSIVLTIGLGGLDVRTPIVVALILLGATAFTLVLDLSKIADLIAICAYYFLVVGVFLNFIAYLRKGEEEDKTTQNSLSV